MHSQLALNPASSLHRSLGASAPLLWLPTISPRSLLKTLYVWRCGGIRLIVFECSCSFLFCYYYRLLVGLLFFDLYVPLLMCLMSHVVQSKKYLSKVSDIFDQISWIILKYSLQIIVSLGICSIFFWLLGIYITNLVYYGPFSFFKSDSSFRIKMCSRI